MTDPRLPLCLGFLAALIPCLAQTPPSARIDGVIVDTVSGGPVRRAVVQLRTSGGSAALAQSLESADFAAVTGPDGTFHFEQLPAASYTLSYSRAGYLLPRISSGFSPRNIRVAAGAAVKGLRYGLIPQAIVSGRILDDEGEPVDGVQVSLLAFRYSAGVRRLVRLGETGTSNDRGEYRIPRVPAGKYFVQATLDRLPPGGSILVAAARTSGAPLVTYASTFYPGAGDPGQALVVQLQAGQELPGIDIPLQRTTMVRVSGRVVGPDGAPMSHATLMLLSSQSRIMTGFGASSDDGGNFVLNNVRAGSYILSAMTGDNRNIAAPLEVGSTDVTGFVAQASPPVSLRGSVLFEDAGRSSNPQSAMVSLSFAESGGIAGSIRPAADGSFTFPRLAPGRYLANAYAGGSGAYVQSISAGGEDALGRDFDLSAAAGGLRIVMRTDSATLSGKVESSEGASAQTERTGHPSVILIPTDSRARSVDQIAPSPVSSKGSFSVPGLRPGEYLALAFDDVDEAQLQDPDFLALLEPLGVRVQLSPGATQTVTLKWNTWPQTAAGN